ncbi:MAG: hypothetical protein OXB93_06535 [Cytophagales bacterium]|nr:hypothetical protein [Cytophagales bacterium]
MKKYFLSCFYGVCLLSLLIFYACGDKKTSSSGEGAEFDEAKRDMINRVDKVIHDLPPPSEIPFILKATGVEYIHGIVNPLSNVNAYSSDTDAALNLGVLACDMSYLSFHGKAQNALDYFEATYELADKVGLNTALFKDLAERFRENITDVDTITVVTNEFLARAERFLEDLDELNAASLALAGSFIEGLYITAKSIENYPQKEIVTESDRILFLPLINIFLEERVALLDLLAMLKSIERNEKVTRLIDDLGILRLKYDELSMYLDDVDGGRISLSGESPIGQVVEEISRIRRETVSIGKQGV